MSEMSDLPASPHDPAAQNPEPARTPGADAPTTRGAAETSPYVPVLLGWLLPGAGHAKIGRPAPALFVALAIWPLFLGGMALAGGLNVHPKRHPWYFATQIPAGLPTIAAAVLTKDRVQTEPLPSKSKGELFTAMAGLLNLIAIADVWARCRNGDPVVSRPADDDAGGPHPDA